MPDIEKEMEAIRCRLLDQSARSGLLNHRPLNRTISLTEGSPREMFDALVTQGRSLRFRTSGKKRGSAAKNSVWERGQEPQSVVLERGHGTIAGELGTNPNTELDLVTLYNKDELEERLFSVYNRSRAIFEEQGFHVLYLAMGFLHYSEGRLGRKWMKAPLILIPVELRRMGRTREFRVTWTGDEVTTNLTLQARLIAENDISLPELIMPESKYEIDRYLDQVVETIEGRKGWKVFDEMHLDVFNFRRFIMYRDLDPANMSLSRGGDLVKSIFNPTLPRNGDSIEEYEVDEKVDPFKSYSILDADSSQTAVIETVKKGSCLLVEGPPGTGKSQTIANIIAELMAEGRKVLFVSEKMAALEVVKNRLDSCGLGDYCLEIHSDKMRKSALLDELRRSLHLDPPEKGRAERDLNELVRLRNELNGYVRELHSEIGVRDLTVYDLYSMKAAADSHFLDRGVKMKRVALEDPSECDEAQWSQALIGLGEGAELLESLGSIRDNPWKGCEPGLVLGPDLERIDGLLKDAVDSLRRLKEAKNRLSSEFGIRPAENSAGVGIMMRAAGLLVESPPADEATLRNSDWDENDWMAEDVIEDLRALEQSKDRLDWGDGPSLLRADVDDHVSAALGAIGAVIRISMRMHRRLVSRVDSTFHTTVFEIPVEHIDEFVSLSQKRIPHINRRWRTLRRDFLSKSRRRIGHKRLVHELESVRALSDNRNRMLLFRSAGDMLSGGRWKGGETDPGVIPLIYDKETHPEEQDIIDILRTPAWTLLAAEGDRILDEVVSRNRIGDMTDGDMEEELNTLSYNAESLSVPFIAHRRSSEGGKLTVASELLAELLQARRLDKRIRASRRGKSLFGSLWKSSGSDPDILDSYAGWIKEFRELYKSGELNDRSMAAVGAGESLADAVVAAERVADEDVKLRRSVTMLLDTLSADAMDVLGSTVAEASHDSIKNSINRWKGSTNQLNRWARYMELRSSMEGTISEPVFDLMDEGGLAAEDVLKTFKGNYADALLKEVLASTPRLRGFVKEIHERNIGKFRDLDRRMIEANRLRVAERVHSQRPNVGEAVSPESEMGILLGELDRKRGVMPIRRLMRQTGGLIQRLKPCFMMSPLSVAQFLDIEGVGFDVVIFDEASQVKPEDALGAIFRGDQLVVVGDTKQLPPTQFFDRITDVTEDGDDGILMSTGMESILGLCRRSFMSKTLRWHYRSRHESLIKVSNHEFYDDRLFIYPSPMQGSEEMGLSLIRIPETVYDRGGSGENRLEAKHVAQMVREHYRNHPGKSLGVGTFNVRQQEAVLREIEELVRAEPSLETMFNNPSDERLFVKNIETIQGDERDVIIVSVGFGYDSEGRMSNNFGPVNQEGGERRLNVLMTRARERCVIVSNFLPSDIRTLPDSPFGLRALKTFMEYAAHGKEQDAARYAQDRGGAFEEAVARYLEGMGHKVHRRIGSAGYRIDLAVVDPRQPTRYMMGIESDGPQYHSSKVARDRDRIRDEILRGLGWKTHRVWSTDWYQSPDNAKRSILAAMTEAGPSMVNKNNGVEEKGVVNTEGISLLVKEYQSCPPLGMPHSPDLSAIDDRLILVAIERIVSFEGPVHKDAVMLRIRDEFGVRRLSPTMRERIRGLMDRAEVNIKDEFLWPKGLKDVSPRRRTKTGLMIEWVAEEEIASALALTLTHMQGDGPEVVKMAARILGFTRMGDVIRNRMGHVLNDLMEGGIVERSPSGGLYLRKR